VLIVGAGAAGLATAIFTLHHAPSARLAIVDGARKPGAKILVSGGSRCNVTNTVVSADDFNGGKSSIVRRILRALPVADTVAFFRGLGVALHEEPGGKLFPDTNRSRDVLAALLTPIEARSGTLRAAHRVHDITHGNGRFEVVTSEGPLTSSAVVLATGGLSLPKTGSDGAGYTFARRFGHRIVPTTPALAPLVLESGADSIHAGLSGVSQPVRLELRVDAAVRTRIDGALLWTHFGASGPAALDLSRHWLRVREDGLTPAVTVSMMPGLTFESADALWLSLTRAQPRTAVQTALATLVPAAVASVVLNACRIQRDVALAALTREDRRRLVHALLEWPLPIRDSRGYAYAEVTAGGADLTEIDPSSMESRRCPGLYLVGEVLDVDGRLGGFNFQWAWSTAKVAAMALAKWLDSREGN
jgi:predicted Rossmann fold flavoprotein